MEPSLLRVGQTRVMASIRRLPVLCKGGPGSAWGEGSEGGGGPEVSGGDASRALCAQGRLHRRMAQPGSPAGQHRMLWEEAAAVEGPCKPGTWVASLCPYTISIEGVWFYL